MNLVRVTMAAIRVAFGIGGKKIQISWAIGLQV